MKYPLFLFFLLFTFSNSFSQTADDLFKEGEIRRKNGDRKEAIALYDKAIAIKEDHPNAHYQRGFCYSAEKNYEKALIDFTRVLELKPGFVWAHISRGSSLNKLNRFQEAIEDFNKALELEPENQEAFNNRGWAKKGLGDDKGACDDWKKSKKMGNEEAKIILGNSGCR